mgnify:CR=1 FL=1
MAGSRAAPRRLRTYTRPRVSLLYVLRRTLHRLLELQVWDVAAAMTFFAALSLLPTVVALVSLVSLLGVQEETVDAAAQLATEIWPSLTPDTVREWILTLGSAGTGTAAVVLGVLGAAGLGLVMGAIAIRRQGIYFAMITLALAQLVFFVFVQAPFTGGENGLQGVPRGHLFGLVDMKNNMAMYYFVLAVFVLGFAIIQRTIHSPYGQVLKAIRENEPRAVSLGYNVDRHKLLAFVISAALAGLAGSTKTVVFQLASLTDAHWHISGEVILMTLLGGVGTILGPLVGATVVVTLQSYLSNGPLGEWVHVILGVIFVLCVLLFRSGIVGWLERLVKRNFK